MPTTRKKVIKTVYKDDDDSEDLGGDFSDSGSDAKISPAPSSDESINEEENCPSSDDDVHKNPQKVSKTNRKKNPQFAKAFISKINKQICAEDDEPLPESTFTIKDLTEADKLLPSVLNLSESGKHLILKNINIIFYGYKCFWSIILHIISRQQ